MNSVNYIDDLTAKVFSEMCNKCSKNVLLQELTKYYNMGMCLSKYYDLTSSIEEMLHECEYQHYCLQIKEKMKLLRIIKIHESVGVQLSQKFDMNSSLEDMQAECDILFDTGSQPNLPNMYDDYDYKYECRPLTLSMGCSADSYCNYECNNCDNCNYECANCSCGNTFAQHHDMNSYFDNMNCEHECNLLDNPVQKRKQTEQKRQLLESILTTVGRMIIEHYLRPNFVLNEKEIKLYEALFDIFADSLANVLSTYKL